MSLQVLLIAHQQLEPYVSLAHTIVVLVIIILLLTTLHLLLLPRLLLQHPYHLLRIHLPQHPSRKFPIGVANRRILLIGLDTTIERHIQWQIIPMDIHSRIYGLDEVHEHQVILLLLTATTEVSSTLLCLIAGRHVEQLQELHGLILRQVALL